MRMARRLEGHGVRRRALGVLTGHNDHPDPITRGDPGTVSWEGRRAAPRVASAEAAGAVPVGSVN
jgi:hypothetical protein